MKRHRIKDKAVKQSDLVDWMYYRGINDYATFIDAASSGDLSAEKIDQVINNIYTLTRKEAIK